MPFMPRAGDLLTIGGIAYQLVEDPLAPSELLQRRGHHSTVYQLRTTEGESANRTMALKVFEPGYRAPRLVAQAELLAGFAYMPGLQAARRTVLSPRAQANLLRQYPDLSYAVLMPWIDGPTWSAVLTDPHARLTPEQSLRLARALAEVLTAMEERGIAHCDLSGPNVMAPGLGEASPADGAAVALVDLEQLYAPGLDRPTYLAVTSPGYIRAGRTELEWGPDGDRFSGALLLAEMLGACDERMRELTWGESYFDPAEIGQESDRYRCLRVVLRERWGKAVSSLFKRAWRAERLGEAPTFGEWLVTLPENVPPGEVVPPVLPTEQEAANDAVIQALIDLGRKLEAAGNPSGAIMAYREARSLIAPNGARTAELSQLIASLERETAAPAPELPSPTVPEAFAPSVQVPEHEVAPLLGASEEKFAPTSRRGSPWGWIIAIILGIAAGLALYGTVVVPYRTALGTVIPLNSAGRTSVEATVAATRPAVGGTVPAGATRGGPGGTRFRQGARGTAMPSPATPEMTEVTPTATEIEMMGAPLTPTAATVETTVAPPLSATATIAPELTPAALPTRVLQTLTTVTPTTRTGAFFGPAVEATLTQTMVTAPAVTRTRRITATATLTPTLPPSPTPTLEPTATFTPVPTPAITVGMTQTRPTDGMVMLAVPAGQFEMGSTITDVQVTMNLCRESGLDCKQDWFAREQPAHQVTLGAFWIDRTEVTSAQFAAFANEKGIQGPDGTIWYSLSTPDHVIERANGKFQPVAGFENYPVVRVTWAGAAAYCEWAGGRLPTEAEWEYAARGAQRFLFPWGNAFDGTRLNYWTTADGYEQTAPVGSYPTGASWVGALDMAGNVAEWVADWFGPYSAEPAVNPTGPAIGDYRVIRGGSWYQGPFDVRTVARGAGNPNETNRGVGFRCVKPVTP